jgi:hypothetical protein
MYNFGGFKERLFNITKKYDIAVEVGGWELSKLVPRPYFLLHRDMFRMKSGRREMSINFCPTSPNTIKVLSQEARKVFLHYSETTIFHLWPDKGHENLWCSCPTCRAFTLEEQNRIAMNAVADVLLSVNPNARLSYYEASAENTDIPMRPNTFKISVLGEDGGWFFAD